MLRHILGVLGVIAASILLVVSMMMNYRFGYSLGKTPTDGQIYGMASAAADCFKALAPFFFFAALRSRVWSQAVAAVLVWVVVTGYALTSALGHAALNRLDTSGQRAMASASYKDLRSDLKRAEDQLKWIPPHRPSETVAAELNVLKAQRRWMTTRECTDATVQKSREFCQHYFKLAAEHASGQEAEKLEVRVAEIAAKLSKVSSGTVMAEADPQASVLARMTGVKLETVQTALTVFVALLIEIGSGFGMYVAFAYWRPHQSLHGAPQPARTVAEAQPAKKEEESQEARKEEAPAAAKADAPIWSSEPAAEAAPPAVRPFGDNDNQNARPAIMPPSDVERFYQEYVDSAGENDWVPSMRLNDAYKLWCKRNDRRPLAMPTFTAEFDKLKVVKHGIGGGVKYFGISLKPEIVRDLERKTSRKRRTALTQTQAAASQSQPAAASKPVAPAAEEATTAQADQLRGAADQMRPAEEPPKGGRDDAKAA